MLFFDRLISLGVSVSTTNHDVASSIPDTSTILNVISCGMGSTQPRENNWVANLWRSSGFD